MVVQGSFPDTQSNSFVLSRQGAQWQGGAGSSEGFGGLLVALGCLLLSLPERPQQ